MWILWIYIDHCFNSYLIFSLTLHGEKSGYSVSIIMILQTGFFKIKNFSYIDFQNAFVHAQMYQLYVVFFKCGWHLIDFVTWTETLKAPGKDKQKWWSWNVQKTDISEGMESKKLSPEADNDVRQQTSQDDLCCQFALVASVLWRTDFALWVTLTCVVLGSLPNRSHDKI